MEDDEEDDDEYVDKDNKGCDKSSEKIGDMGGSTRLQLLAELMDSSPLEDECKPKLYCCNRVMEPKAGRKSNRELPQLWTIQA